MCLSLVLTFEGVISMHMLSQYSIVTQDPLANVYCIPSCFVDTLLCHVVIMEQAVRGI